MANPTAPGGEMLGERNPDSVLFDIKKLDGDEDRGSSARAGKGSSSTEEEPPGEEAKKEPPAAAEEEPSGLIDVKKVLADTEAPAPVALDPLTRNLTPAPSSESPSEPAPDRLRNILLLASALTILIVGALLAMKAMS